MYKFNKTSLDRLDTCDRRLQEIDNRAITHAPYDYGIACGYRDSKTQQQKFDEGKSNAKPGHSAHNKTLNGHKNSEGVDIFLVDVLGISEDGKALWGHESKLARQMMIEVQRYREGIAYALGYPIKVMPTLKDGTEDLGHCELA